MSGTTRTIGPLHFEDLEPKRFEDLVRQLVYDFRPWRALEATGRAGSDEGYDARGFEIVAPFDASDDNRRDDEEQDAGENSAADRLWLIQCKRERSITPAKIRQHLIDIHPSSLVGLYGVIFVAACDFSKKTRDEFIKWRSEIGLMEGYIWGKAELEDQLFQPKNDSLLFAYFGFSLRIKQRSMRTEVRSRLAAKRKCKRLLPGTYSNILVRDPTDHRYPFLNEGDSNPARWKVFRYIGDHLRGIMVEIYSHYAFLDDDQESWDIFEPIKNGLLGEFDDPWFDESLRTDDRPHEPIWSYWNSLDDKNKANLTVFDIIPYDNMIDIDERTDEIFPGVTVYVDNGLRFDRRACIENLLRFNAVKVRPHADKRIKHFPDKFPDPEPPIESSPTKFQE